jgi:hypothetical protein
MVILFPLSYQFYHDVFHSGHHVCHAQECVENRMHSNTDQTLSHPHDLCLISHFEYVSSYQNNQTIQIESDSYVQILKFDGIKEQEFSSIPLSQQLRAPPFQS